MAKKPHPLRAWRLAKSPPWSQQFLADRIGVPRWSVACVETRKAVAAKWIAKIAKATGVQLG